MYACTYVHTYVCGRQRAGSQMGICEDMDARDQACQHAGNQLMHPCCWFGFASMRNLRLAGSQQSWQPRWLKFGSQVDGSKLANGWQPAELATTMVLSRRPTRAATHGLVHLHARPGGMTISPLMWMTGLMGMRPFWAHRTAHNTTKEPEPQIPTASFFPML